jgi:hypothetical protein
MTIPVDPIDPNPTAEFQSWELALTEGRLKREQFVTLQTMVDEGKASTLKEAASVLDLEETIIHPAEHMWGT